LLPLFYLLLRHFGPQHWWPAKGPFEVMVGAVLTQNTAWKNVERAIANLKEKGVLDPVSMAALPADTLAELIRPAGFFRVKASRLKSLVAFLMEHYQGDVGLMAKEPGWLLRERLLAVRGVGEETADSILLYALDKPFFVVDAYTRRILTRQGVISGRERYGEIQRFFMDQLPADVELFKEFHALLVELGKRYCRSRVPLCRECPLYLEVGCG